MYFGAVMEKLKVCHRAAQGFFRARKEEATLPRAIGMLVLLILLSSASNTMSAYGEDISLLIWALKAVPATVAGSFLKIWPMLFLEFVVVGTPIAGVWIARALKKSKKNDLAGPSGTQIIYLYNIVLALWFLWAVFVQAILLFKYGPFELVLNIILGTGSLLVSVLFTYSSIMAVIELTRKSAITFQEWIIGSVLIGFVVSGVAFMLVGLLVEVPNITTEAFVTNNSNGSFTIEYLNIVHNSQNEKQVCNVTFPSGWQISTEQEYINKYGRGFGFSAHGDNGYKWVYKKPEPWGEIREFVLFGYSYQRPPIDNDRVLNAIKNAYEVGLAGGSGDDGFTIENATLVTNEETGMRWVDVYQTKENQARHEVTAGSVDLLMVNMVYEVPFGKDKDFYSIVNSIRCYRS